MPGNITVSSTTDSQSQVEEAASYGSLPFPEEEKPATPEADEAETAPVPETARKDSEEEEEPPEEEEIPQEEEDQPAEAAAKPVGRTRRQREATIARLLARVDDLERQLKRKPEPEKPKADYSLRPRTDDPKYKDKGIEDVIEDMVRHVQQKDAEQKAQTEQTEAQQKQQQRIDAIYSDYRQQVQEAEDKYEDFDEVVARNTLPMAAQLAIVPMPNGAEVAYYVNQHPEIVEQLVKWDNPDDKIGYNRIIQKLADISDELSGNQEGNQNAPTTRAQSDSASSGSVPSNDGSSSSPRALKPRSSPPAPIRPVGGAATNPSQGGYRENMSFREYKKLRESGWDGPGRY